MFNDVIYQYMRLEWDRFQLYLCHYSWVQTAVILWYSNTVYYGSRKIVCVVFIVCSIACSNSNHGNRIITNNVCSPPGFSINWDQLFSNNNINLALGDFFMYYIIYLYGDRHLHRRK